MIKFSVLFELALTVLALLFFPRESRFLLFELKPQDWYGEMSLGHGDDIYILAKNSGNEEISALVSVPPLHLTRHLDSEDVHFLGAATEVPPFSVSLLRVPRQSLEPPQRQVWNGSGFHFRPSELKVSTRSDEYLPFVMAVILIFSFCLLAFVCSIHINERRHLVVDREV